MTSSTTARAQHSVQDFPELKLAWADNIGAIIGNPPYSLAQQFVRHALTFMLLRLTFYESERRRGVLDGAGLVRVHVFRNRLPMMQAAAFQGILHLNAVFNSSRAARWAA